MKTGIFVIITLCLALTLTARAQVPGIINYQGRVSVSGTNFNGSGQFEFALVDGGNNASIQATASVGSFDGSQGIAAMTVGNPGSGYTSVPNVIITDSTGTGAVLVADLDVTDGGIITNIEVIADGANYTSPTITIDPPPASIVYNTYWSNDGTSASGSQTVSAVSLTVTKGLYSVLLGDTTVSNMTVAVPASAFANSSVNLRVWFNDGVHGFQQLTPDQRLAAAGYALHAAIADSIAPSSFVQGQYLDIGIGNSLYGEYASIAGGQDNTASAQDSFVGGGMGNQAGDIDATVGGGFENTASVAYATVAGGAENTASGYGTFVGGGAGDIASAEYSTVGGGVGNTAGGFRSTVGGGDGNIASAEYSTVGGGVDNTASGPGAFVGGGGYNSGSSQGNTAGGAASTVPGGYDNNAGGNYSFAAGQQAQALHTGAFVWSDDSGGAFASTTINEFSVRAAGGVRFFSNSGASLGAQLAANATAWTTLSDRNAKENIHPINVRDILDELVAMPISRWNYKDDPTQRRYIGPMAQDFHSAFGLGDDDKRINTLDSESVALAAIQGLNQKVEQQRAELQAKQSEIDGLKHRLADLETKMEKVSEQLDETKPAPQPASNVRDQGGL